MIVTCVPTVSKTALLAGGFLASDVYKIALFLSSATLNESTGIYSNTGEIPTSGGYTQGGLTLTRVASTSGTTVYVDFNIGGVANAPAVWNNVTVNQPSAIGGFVIYDFTDTNKKILYIGKFTSDLNPNSGTVTINWPAVGATSLIRLS